MNGRIFRIVTYAAVCTAVAPLPAADRLSSAGSVVLEQGQKLTSANGQYELVMQSDGHLCIYKSGKFVWGNGAYAKGAQPYRLAMRSDSSLVQTGSTGETWSSGVRSSGKAPYTVVMQDDGNLAIYDNANSHIWSWMHPNYLPIITSTITGNDKATAENLWNTYYAPLELPPNPAWSSKSQCDPGTTSPEYQAAVLKRLNYFRRMAGLPDLEIDPNLTAAAQAGAHWTYVNNTLNHTPPSNSTCYSQLAYTGTSTSNLSSNVNVSAALDGWVMEKVQDVPSLGHRWYILNPYQWKTALGNVPGELQNPSKTHKAAMITINAAKHSTATMKNGFSGWPPPGYVPSQLIPKDWTIQVPDKDFTTSTFSVTVNGTAVTATTPKDMNITKNTVQFAPPAGTVSGGETTWNVAVSGGGVTLNYKVIAYTAAKPLPIISVWPMTNSASFPFFGQFILPDSADLDLQNNTKYTFVPGDGAVDNAKFTMEPSGMTFKSVQNLTQAASAGAYKVRIEATGPQGQKKQQAVQFP